MIVNNPYTITPPCECEEGDLHQLTTGYLHRQYASSFAEFGAPRELPRCGGWVLERETPCIPRRDAMGCYPLFACRDWSQLAADLEDMAGDVVCLSAVTDPFGAYDEALLRECFPDKVVPFKEHFCIELDRPLEEYVHRDHRRKAHKALARLHVEVCEDAAQFLDDWTGLYGQLIQRHGITGMLAFSRTTFAQQFEVPGFVSFRALHHDAPVGMALLYVQGNVVYGHLLACNALGYELNSTSALYWHAIEYFRDRGLKWFDLGAGAGVGRDGTDGLTQFKRGWSTGTRTAYFCGRIFDRAAYDQIVRTKGDAATTYFPAYRVGEFR
jgi:hypothetical protein